MKVSEFNGTGDFLLGTKLAGFYPVFSVTSEEFSQTIKVNFKINVRTFLPENCKDIPRTDIACIRPPIEDMDKWLKTILNLNPRIIIIEGKSSQDFINLIDKNQFDFYSSEYTGIEMGLPHLGKKIFNVVVKKDITARSKYFHMPESDQKERKIGDILDIQNDKDLYVEKAPAFAISLDDNGLAKSVPLRYDKSCTMLVRGGRKVSPKELSRLAGFSDDFILPDDKALAYTIVGISTWPKAIFRIAKEIKEWIL